jgi:sugar-specific transcriptional regulator TrmB|tara:strand:- start:1779 stop:2540 length:762 start_codon:yes stop_codon:yes gene_type:complete
MEQKVLREIGFTEGEIKVYYALFDLGETSVGPLAKKSGVTHAKVYPILDKLIEKGLVSKITKENTMHFNTNSASRLLDFVNNKMRALETEKSKLKEIIPTLQAKQKYTEQSQYARVIVGFKGIKSMFEDLYTNAEGKKEVFVLGHGDELYEKRFQSFFRDYHKMRISKNVYLRLLIHDRLKKIMDEKYKSQGNYKKGEVRYCNTDYPTGVFIFRDHVITFVGGDEITAFDIKSQHNAERYRKFFYSLWEKNKK